MSERVGKEVKVGASNVSPKRELALSSGVESELRAFMEPEYRIYNQAIGKI